MLIFPLQPGTEVGSQLCADLLKFFKKHKSEFENKLVGDLSYIDNRANCQTGIEVEDVQYQDGTFFLSYSFEWTIYNGCAGLDNSGIEEETADFTIDDATGEIEFNFPDPSEFTPRNREFDL